MKNLKFYLILTLFVILLFAIGLQYECCYYSKPADSVSYKKSPNDPGWEKDLKRFKYRESDDVPENLSLYYRKTILYNKNTQLREESHLFNVVEMGPSNISGRSRAYLIDSRDPDHHFAGSVSGGLWETFDNASTWKPLLDKEQNMSVTYITQNPFDPDIIYFSTGEVAANSAGVDGVGVFKSMDGGKHFELLPGSQQNGLFRTWRIVCSQTDKNTLYVVSPSGVYVSRDAGASFNRVYFEDCTDIEVLKDSTVLIAVKEQGIFTSKESDLKHWTKLAFPDLGKKKFRRIELAVCDSFPDNMYAALEDKGSTRLLGILRSEDHGQSWKLANPPGMNTNYAWYTHTLQIHPERPNVVIYGNIQMMATYNGGKSWKTLQSSHADKHLYYFDPLDPDHFISTHDGGMDEYLYLDKEFEYGGSLRTGFNVTQYYAGDYFPDEDRVIGGAQDNGTTSGTVKSQAFMKVIGADGGFCAVAKDNSEVVFMSTQNGNIFRTYNFHSSPPRISYVSGKSNGISSGGNYFIAPFYMNDQNSKELIFMKSKAIWYTKSYGDYWTAIDTLTSSPYAGLIVSREDKTTVFAGGSNGRLFRYDDVQMNEIRRRVKLTENQPRILRNAFLRNIILDPRDSSSLYVCFSSVSGQPRIWHVEEAFGQQPRWVNASGDLPAFLPVNDIAVSEMDPYELAAGTDYGVYTSVDGGVHWLRDTAIPNVAVFQIKIRPTDNKLFVFTHGRGAWMADFKVDPTATREPEDNGLDFVVYPNPAKEYLNIKIQDRGVCQYETVDIMGRVLLHGNLEGVDHFISIRDLIPGHYTLRLMDTQGKSKIHPFTKL